MMTTQTKSRKSRSRPSHSSSAVIHHIEHPQVWNPWMVEGVNVMIFLCYRMFSPFLIIMLDTLQVLFIGLILIPVGKVTLNFLASPMMAHDQIHMFTCTVGCSSLFLCTSFISSSIQILAKQTSPTTHITMFYIVDDTYKPFRVHHFLFLYLLLIFFH